MSWLWYPIGAVCFVLLIVFTWRASDAREDRQAWIKLIELGSPTGAVYRSDLVADLPEPARRFFNYSIHPGTPLTTVIEIEMEGDLGLGTKDAPNYQPMQAKQILSPPFGLVWRVKAGPMNGSDGATPEASWTRFWLFGLIPVVRADGPDHRRSAFGRVVAEGAIWAPASLLPGDFVHWEAVDENSARAIVAYGNFTQPVELTVDETGAPTQFVIPRWSNENPQNVFRVQPFGGYLSEFREFHGYMLPTRVEGGNLFGTPDYFPFFKATVTSVRIPKAKP